MSDDLMDAFNEVMVEGGENPDSLLENPISRNANVFMGDDDVALSDGGDDDSEIDDSDIDVVDESADDDEVDDIDVTDGFDFDSIKDKTVSVTVNGETFEVPLAELRNGYMRQSDYTRKTQQIAAEADMLRWARDLQEAFRVDPAGSVRYLQEQLGISTQDVDPLEDIDPEMQPIVAELWRTRQELDELRYQTEQINQERVNASVRAELDSMLAKYPDFDPSQVLPLALEHGVRMEQAYKLWKADVLVAENAAAQAARLKAEKAAEQRAKAKKATKQVSKGSSLTATEDSGWRNFDSFESIFEFEMNRT